MSLLLLFGGPGVPAGPAELTVHAEIDFTGTGTWVDVSPYLVAGDISRGKQRELERYQAGTMTLTLRDDDRRFDPQNTAGPYYPDVKPMRRARLRVTYGPTTYPRFFGYVDRWTGQPDGPHTATVQVDCTDYFKVLAKTRLPTGAYAAEVAADGPLRWWRLDQPDGSTIVYDSVGDMDLTIAGSPEFGVDGLAARDATTAMEITGAGQGGYATGPGQAWTAFTVELLFRSAATDDGNFYTESNALGTQGFVLRADGDPDFVNAIVVTTAGTLALVDASGQVDDDATHHYALTWDGATVKLWVDGVVVDSGALAGTIPASSESLAFLGGYTLGPNSADGVYGVYDEVAVYDHDIGAARVAAHVASVATPWDGDTVGERATRVADIADRSWYGEVNPLAPARDFDTGSSTLQSAVLDMTALEHLQKVAESEMGAFYVEADGTLRMKGRSALVNGESAQTFTDAHGSDPAIATYSPEYGDDLIYNDVVVSRSEGVAQQATDPDSIAEYLTGSYTLDGLYNDNDDDTRAMAQLIVSEHAQPLQRIAGLVVRPRSGPDVLFPAVLALDLTAVVTVEVTPQHTGAETSQVSVIEGIYDRFGPKEWETTLSVSPALGAGTGPFGVWDSPAWNESRWFF